MRREPSPAPAVQSISRPAAASFNTWARSRPDLARQSRDRLLQATHDLDLLVHGRPLCNVLRPRFLAAPEFEQLVRDSEAVAAIFQRAGEYLLSSPHILDALDASDEERSLWEVDPGYKDITATSRLDAFLDGGRAHFVEYNAESPASIGFNDVLTAIFASLPLVMEWPDQPSLRSFDARRCLWETLIDVFHEWGGKGLPSIAVVDWQTVLTRRDFELCAEYFRERGAGCVVVDPRDLQYRSGRLWYDDTPIDLVYRRVLLHELLEMAGEARALLGAYRDGAVCMVNSPRSKLLHKKSVMALLSEGSRDIPMTDEERDALARTVPWTRLLRDGVTSHGGAKVDLASFALSNQENLALKPSDDYGGRGVVLGWDVSPEEWDRALESAMNAPFVIQERVPVPHAEFPTWNDGVTLVPLLVDTDPLLFRGRVGAILTRTSSDPVLNVTAGSGSTTPTLVVEAEA